MTVQRYVFRYKPRTAAYYADIILRWREAGHNVSGFRDPAVEAEAWNSNFAGTYEKEGGGYTRELSEAKLIGWRSTRFMGRTDGDLLPAKIVIE